ncbi:hypothetical protein B0H63DRAFT_517369 [Podospora didyma]|uniref:NmrA-like domain-containing protein n=1 Tax=Podospora didyma TaxID=330526 RepID=A0AAE0P6H4_9PEZI|nr:hypothetical protein B0H63DRAFT_517369 [Podospora didyma]
MDSKPPKPPILVVGGTVAARHASDEHGIMFDWNDKHTWSNAFAAAASGSRDGSGIKAVFLIAPPIIDSAPVMMEFIDFARERGVRRFVLLSASAIEAGGPAMGKVHAYLRELGTRGEVDWAVLRPSWFQQNFAEQPNHVKSIKEENKIYSATSDAKIPWVSADDIAAVAAHVLMTPEPPNTEYLVLGPELLSYSEIADILTDVLGRKIVHVDMSSNDLEKRHQSFGMSAEYAKTLSALDTAIKFGSENRTNDVILTLTGLAPKRFRQYAESHKDVWGPGELRKHVDVYAS